MLVCIVLTARSPYVMKCQREITPTPLLVFSARLPARLRVELRPICLEHFQGGGAKREDLTTGVFFKPALSHIQL